MIGGLFDRLRHLGRLRRWPHEQAMGRRGEDLAHRLLRREGLIVVARNYRPRRGNAEVDLVAWDGDTLVFVEVKSRGTDEFGSPDRAVDREKQEALIRGARDYTRRSGIAWDRVRFDVVNVVLSEPPSVWRVKNAFPRSLAL